MAVRPVLLAALAWLAAACASSPPPSARSAAVFANIRRGKAPRTRTARVPLRRAPAAAPLPVPTAAGLVARTLEAQGMTVGGDGRPEALYEYLRSSRGIVPPRAARPGDVVFFDMEGRGCGDHVAVVETVTPGGRLSFRESRGGQVRVSYAQPDLPRQRRDTAGQVLNTFLRPKRPEDPIGTRYFAGEMLCGVSPIDPPRAPGRLAAR